MRARGAGEPARPAIEELCERYWFPIYGFARRKCGSVHQAQDLTQAFFVDLLERDLIRRADPTRGRFRTFLLTAFQNFASHERDRQNAAKRGGGRTQLSLDFGWAESRLALEPATNETPERHFERLWGLQMLDAALAAVEAQYEARGNAATFHALKPFMLAEQCDTSLASIAKEIGISAGAAKVALHRLRARYRHALRDQICATLVNESDAEDEIRRLFSVFA